MLCPWMGETRPRESSLMTVSANFVRPGNAMLPAHASRSQKYCVDVEGLMRQIILSLTWYILGASGILVVATTRSSQSFDASFDDREGGGGAAAGPQDPQLSQRFWPARNVAKGMVTIGSRIQRGS